MKKLSIKSIIRPASVLAFILALSLVLPACARSEGGEGTPTTGTQTYVEPASKRHNYETQKGSLTVMMYLVGSDLETYLGAASTDLEEILDAELSDDINFIIQYGGAEEWQNDDFTDGGAGRYIVKDGKLELVEDLGTYPMLRTESLAEFLAWGAENYPANRYAAVLWDHGGGTMGGFGIDEMFPGEDLSIDEISKAFKDSDVYFDFVGFDACLMATIEIAYALKDSARYLIASEESEASLGWYYTDWLTALSSDIMMDSEKVGRNIIDGFLDKNDDSSREWGTYMTDEQDVATLSMIDLSLIDDAYEAIKNYLDISHDHLKNDYFSRFAKARINARSFGYDNYEQVDILDYIDQVALSDTFDIERAISNCIIYNNSNISGCNGLAMYYPYHMLEEYSDMESLIADVGFDEDYFEYFNTFCSIMAVGQDGYDTYDDWYSYEDGMDYYSGETLATGELEFVEEFGEWALPISEEEWDVIAKIELEVYVDTGEDYRFMGTDNRYQLNDNDSLRGWYDYQWVTIDGRMVPQYFMEDGYSDDGSYYYSLSYVPAERNGEDIRIILAYYSYDGDVVMAVTGFTYEEDEGTGYEVPVYAFEPGDEIRYYSSMYTYDMEDNGLWYMYDAFTLGEGCFDDLVVEYGEIDVTGIIRYRITDIYTNEHFTEVLTI